MPFAEDFSQILQQSGIALDASKVPSQDEIQSGLDGLDAWLESLEPDTKSAADEVTADFPVKAGLADPKVGIAPELSSILMAADKSPVTLDISGLLKICRNAVKQASDGKAFGINGTYSASSLGSNVSTTENVDFERFKRCMRIQAGLDLEAWDFILFQHLRDLHAWWT